MIVVYETFEGDWRYEKYGEKYRLVFRTRDGSRFYPARVKNYPLEGSLEEVMTAIDKNTRENKGIILRKSINNSVYVSSEIIEILGERGRLIYTPGYSLDFHTEETIYYGKSMEDVKRAIKWAREHSTWNGANIKWNIVSLDEYESSGSIDVQGEYQDFDWVFDSPSGVFTATIDNLDIFGRMESEFFELAVKNKWNCHVVERHRKTVIIDCGGKRFYAHENKEMFEVIGERYFQEITYEGVKMLFTSDTDWIDSMPEWAEKIVCNKTACKIAGKYTMVLPRYVSERIDFRKIENSVREAVGLNAVIEKIVWDFQGNGVYVVFRAGDIEFVVKMLYTDGAMGPVETYWYDGDGSFKKFNGVDELFAIIKKNSPRRVIATEKKTVYEYGEKRVEVGIKEVDSVEVFYVNSS